MTVRIQQTTDIATCHALRRVVFVHEQHVPDAEEWDDLDADCVHFLVYVADEPVGTARLREVSGKIKLERIALRKSARGKGYGEQLMHYVLDYARTHTDATLAVLSGQVQAVPFYEKLGFTVCSEVYMDAGIAHRTMQRTLR